MDQIRKVVRFIVLGTFVVGAQTTVVTVHKYGVTSNDKPLQVVDVFRCGLKHVKNGNAAFRISEKSSGCSSANTPLSADDSETGTVDFSTENIHVLYSCPVTISNGELLSFSAPFVPTSGSRIHITIGNLSGCARIQVEGGKHVIDVHLKGQYVYIKSYARSVSGQQQPPTVSMKLDQGRNNVTINIQSDEYIIRLNDDLENKVPRPLQAAPLDRVTYYTPAGCSFTIYSVDFQEAPPPSECSDLSIPARQNDTYRIYPNGMLQEPRTVYCEFGTDGDAWTVIQRRLDGSVNFYRNWENYKHGFDSASGEYWLGNDVIYKLTSSVPHELLVLMSDLDGETRYAHYTSFRLADEADNYRLSIAGYTGTAGNALSFHNEHQFSTFDRDNDKREDNCAITFTGAWWFFRCHQSNLNGQYLNGSGVAYGKGIVWWTWHGHRYSLTTTTMMIRRR